MTMVHDRLSKQESGELLDQRVHVVTTMQELRHSPQNFVRLAGDYLGDDGTLSRAMATCPHHIDLFDWQYEKAFVGNPLFGADLVDRIHKWAQAFLHLCNTTCLDDVETGALSEFGKIQWCVERGKWMTSTPIWV